MARSIMRVEFIGEASDLQLLAFAFCDMEHLGKMGASRRIVLSIDGDGGGQVQVNFPDFEEDPFPSDECRRSLNDGSDIRYLIGD